MRVSTSTVYDQGVTNILRGQSRLIEIQEQIATGRRVLTPSDDPVASAKAVEVSQAKAVNVQYGRNSESAANALLLQEEALGRYTRLLQDVKTLTVTAGNGAFTSRELENIASELRGRYEELLGIANTTDSDGVYLFSGFQGGTVPFSEDSPGVVTYNGDQGQRLVQIGASRQVPVSSAGADVFQRIPSGNGTFVTAAADTNTGTGVVSPGVVRDPAAWSAAGNPGNFEVRFDVDSASVPALTTYDIVDTTTGVSLLTGAAAAATGPFLRTYQSGGSISLVRQATDTNPVAFDFGVELSVSGQPADGDRFTVAPSTSRDVFTTVFELVRSLELAGPGATANTRLANALNTAQSSIDNALGVNLTVLASVGTYSKEVELTREVTADLSVQFDRTLSQLQDLDYASAITALSYQQVSLDAAQKSFMKVQELSLFNFL